jgi:hypothetical protein
MEFDLSNYTNLKNNNSNTNINTPSLVDKGVKYFFKSTLRECHRFKQNNYNNFYNISMFIVFFGILGIILFVRYKGNKSKKEMYEKNLKDKQYIMSKLMYYNKQNIDNQQRIKNNMITNLPDYNDHPEANLLHKKIYF